MIGDVAGGGLRNAIRAEQLDRWLKGERLLAEDYLARHASLREDAEAAVSIVYHEILLRESSGEEPRVEEYLNRFPPLASRLRLLFEVHDAVKSLCQPGFVSSSGQQSVSSPKGDETNSECWPTIPGYQILGELGRGGMGVVYKAQQVSLKRIVALKMIRGVAPAGSPELARLGAEAEAAARLKHANIVQIYEIGEQGGQPYLVLEFVEGGSLAERVSGAPQPVRHAAELVETLARAVHEAHLQGIVHRDLKPANVLLTIEGNPKIADFGLAKRIDVEAGQTASGAILGTPRYMAPEQASGCSAAVGPGADIYALGAILYELLTGRPPFMAESPVETLLLVRSSDPVPPSRLRPRLPRDLETICLKCLEKEPARRYANSATLADDLRRYLQGEPIRARRLGWWGRGMKWVRRRPAAAALVALSVLALIGMVVGNVWYRERLNAVQAASLVRSLEVSDTESVPQVVQQLKGYSRWADPLLRRAIGEAPAGSRRQLHARLALLPVDPEQAGPLAEQLLVSQPRELLVIRERLRANHGEQARRLWSVLEDRSIDIDKRFRAACALAAFDPSDTRWAEFGRDIAGQLVKENPVLLGDWTEALRPVRSALVAPLAEVFRDRNRAETERSLATSLLADYLADRPENLVDLALDADERQYLALMPKLRQHRERVAGLLRAELGRSPGHAWRDPPLETFSRSPDPVMEQRIGEAGGMLAERFALCQSMLLDRFIVVAEGLRGSGYRPIRFRPHSSPDGVRAAAVWTRDGAPWELVTGVEAETLLRHDAEMRRRGFLPADVAGYLSPSPGRVNVVHYAALWSPPSRRGEGDPRMELGLTEPQLKALHDGKGGASDSFLAIQTMIGPKGQALTNLIRVKGERKTEVPGPFLGDEITYEHAHTGGILADVSVCRPSSLPDPTAAARAELSGAEKDLMAKPGEPSALLRRARARLELGQTQAAIDDLSVAIEKAPRMLEAQRSLALAQARAGRFTEARKSLVEIKSIIDPLENGTYLYDAARVNALEARAESTRPDVAGTLTERALNLVREALVEGFDEYALLQNDPEWEQLHAHPEFPNLGKREGLGCLYSAIWSDRDDLEAQADQKLDRSACLERSSALAAQGYRPASICVASEEHGHSPRVAMIWHRPIAPIDVRVKQARRRARAAVALLQLGHPAEAWSLMRNGTDPTSRTELIHSLSRLGADAEVLIRQLKIGQDDSTRRGLILALGEFEGGWSSATQSTVGSQLLDLYRGDPDPGVHSAAEWVLRRWGKAEDLRRVDEELAAQNPRARFGWLLNKHRQTFTIVRGPVEFRSGSLPQERGRYWNEPPHFKRINHSFAIATKEVTMAQFERFLQEHSEISIDTNRKFSPDPDCPVNSVNWYTAVAFCRWLSEQEGFHESQMCYPPIAQIKEGMELPADFLARTGYRLPTDAEWEYACRAGAETIRPHGEDVAVIPHYSWFAGNAGDRTHPVGLLKPNDLGLFDILGNVVEWCQDPGVLCEPGPRGWSSDDRPILTPVLDKTMRILRGGAYDDQPENLRSAKRNGFLPTYRFTYNGLRLARTLP